MALLNRKNKNDVPAEIQEYYQTEKRERAGVAWLLAFGTLIVTIVLAAGIFFAGRWAYRQIAGDDNGGETTEVAQNEDQGEEDQPAEDQPTEIPGDETTDEGTGSAEGESQTEGDRAEEQPAESRDDQPAAQDDEGQVDDQAATTDTTDDQSGSVAGDTDDRNEGREIAAAGDAIPETGPGDTLAIFLAVSILGYAIHRAATRKATD